MGSWLEAIKTKFEETFHPAHLIAGVCKSPNLEQVKDLLEHWRISDWKSENHDCLRKLYASAWIGRRKAGRRCR